MDFLKAFAEARKQGLTKEEFLPIWENESKMKLMIEEAKLLQLRQPPQKTSLDTSNNHYKGPEIESLILQQKQQLQKVIQEVNELGEKQRQQIQQQAKIKDEISKLSKNLSNQILNGVEALKIWFTQTLDERLGKPLEIQTIDGKKNLSFSRASCEVMSQINLEELDHVGDIPGLHVQYFHKQREQEVMEKGLEMSSSETNNAAKDDWKLVGQKGKIKQNPAANTGAIAAANFNGLSDATLSDSMSYMMLLEEGNQGQMYEHNIAEVVNGRRAQSTIRYHTKEAWRRNADITSKNLSINYFPDTGAEFFIPSIRVFQASNQDFFTENFYTRPKVCKVRLRLWFNKCGRLGVHLLVSEGILDERHNWPLVFNGGGHIYNQSSGSYTRLWTIKSQQCSKPMKNKEETLGAYVCLSTSRDPNPDVTYELLMKKRYVADGDRLLFRWFVESTEKKDDCHDSCEYAYAGITNSL